MMSSKQLCDAPICRLPSRLARLAIPRIAFCVNVNRARKVRLHHNLVAHVSDSLSILTGLRTCGEAHQFPTAAGLSILLGASRWARRTSLSNVGIWIGAYWMCPGASNYTDPVSCQIFEF